MEQQSLPKTVRDLSAHLQVTFVQLLLPCKFCYSFLTTNDKLLFDLFGLQLVYRGGYPYGACQPCLSSCCKIEFLMFYEDTLDGHGVVATTGKSLQEHPVRCVLCAKLLTPSEKDSVVHFGEKVHKVRGRFKAKCGLCRLACI
ncbi:E6 [Castor canadensis papillomavirus 1]|uniref:Protein E6 n=1 Tax=Castor canadensis papillomavirus 1 TaxID=1352235 RepID=V9P7V8_9PAPI|nr:E6 [Castor canadensis papillomavirus 1]AGV05014.1 E6 [Castor canadensis papillomavirus 1]